MTRIMLPPRNLVYPTKAVFRRNKLPPELWETWSILRAIAWVNGYEFTPPTSIQDLVDLHNGSGMSERRIEARALIDRLEKLEERQWVTVKRESGKKNVYYPIVPEDTAFSTERASDYRGIAADSMRGDGKSAKQSDPNRVEQLTYAVDCTPPIVEEEGIYSLPVLDETKPSPSSSTCTRTVSTYAQTKKILRGCGFYEPALTQRANVVPPDVARAWARWIEWALANPDLTGVDKPSGVANFRLREDPTAEPENMAEVAAWEHECAEDKRIAQMHERGVERAITEYDTRHAEIAQKQVALRDALDTERGIVRTATPTYPATMPDVAGTAQEVFHALLGELQLQMTKATFDTWVRPLKTLGFDADANALVILCHSPYAKEWHENRLSTTVQRTLVGVVGRSLQIKYVIQ